MQFSQWFYRQIQVSTEGFLWALEQLALIQHFPEPVWSEESDAIWGSVTLLWAVTKTYQHTLEHTDEVLRAYLWGK